jgi:hypothetical protein
MPVPKLASSRRLRFFGGYLLFLLAFVLCVHYALYLRYLYKLEKRVKPLGPVVATAGMEADTIWRLGYFLSGKQSSFVHFSPAKPPGTIRVGAFGDSFTYGQEVDEVSDFPDRLQELLAPILNDVQVINFGNSGHGFGQSYIMWNEVGRKFDLDYIVLGPATFFPDRDTRFNRFYQGEPDVLHSRFIIDGDKVRQIDPIGTTQAERFRNYVSFFTPWPYVRYDRNDPAFLAALLPEGRTLGNPFYYDRRSEESEAIEIYHRLIERMAQTGSRIVLGAYSWIDQGRQAAADLAGERLCAAQFVRLIRFPYLAALGHDSPTGNMLLARQYLALLLGKPLEAPILLNEDLTPDAAPPRVPTAELASYDEAYIALNGIDAGIFGEAIATPPGVDISGAESPRTFLRDHGVRSLIAFKSAGSSMLDASFVSLTDDLDTTAPVRLVRRSTGGIEELQLGTLRRLGEGLNLASLDVPGFEAWWLRPIMISAGNLKKLFATPADGATFRLLLGEKVLLEGSAGADGSVDLRPVEGQIYLLRATAGGDAAADRGERAGLAELVLRRGAETIRVPVARWWIEPQRLDPSAVCPPEWKPPLRPRAPDADEARTRIRSSG